MPLSHPAECHPIFENDGIVYYTRRLNLVSNLHTVLVGLIPLCICDNCCIVPVYGPTSIIAAWLEIYAIQNHTPTSQHSSCHLHHSIPSEYSTLHPALCPHTRIKTVFLPQHHQYMEQPTTCHNQQHNHTTT